MPLLGRLYIRKTDLPKLPDAVDWEFQTKPELAAEVITWAGTVEAGPPSPSATAMTMELLWTSRPT